MPSTEAEAPAKSSAASILLHDHVLQLAAWLFALEAVLIAVPLVDAGTLALFGFARIEIPLMAAAALAAFYTLNLIDDGGEHGFWRTLGAGCLLWLITLAVTAAVPHDTGGPARDAVAAAGYLGLCVLFLLAAEFVPHLPQIADHRAGARRLVGWSVALASLGWLAYFVAVPMAMGPTQPASLLRTGPLFVVVDLMIVTRYLSLAIGARSPRWTRLYAAIAAAMGAMLIADLLDVLIATHTIAGPGGAWVTVFRGVPPLCLVVAVRLRHVAWRRTDPLTATGERLRDRRPEAVAFGLMALAAAFPIVHVVLAETGLLTPSVQAAQQIVALAAMVGIGGMAIGVYGKLDRDREATARARAALERRLAEAKKMEALSRLSAVVTHEFLNLLNAIGGYIDLTLDDLGTGHADADNLRRAHDVVRRTTGFTTRLLVLSRGRPFRPASVVLNRTIRGLMPKVRGLIARATMVEDAVGSDEGRVAISAEYLSEVLMSLVTNAGEAMEHGGRLRIETSWVDIGPQEAMTRAVRPGRYGRVVVRDTGAGMPKEVLAHLFEPFFTTKPKPRNRGLGLSTAYVVVNQHGGSIAVTSELEVGTTVEFVIPAVSGTGESGRGIRD